MPGSALEARKVTFRYEDGTKALDEISLDIPEDKKVAVLGPNGAGKSTLFLHFNGILKCDEGSILFRGSEISHRKKDLKKLRRKVGIVFEDPDSQLFSGSIYQEISFGPSNIGLSDEEVRRRVRRSMEITDIEDLSDKSTHLLSFGQKKMVSIASIIAMEPEVIIFDEPTAGLDPARANQIVDFLDRLNERDTTVIMSTHDVNLAYSWADYCFLLNEGKKTAEGRPEDLFRNDNLLEEVNLEKPGVLEIFESLKGTDLVNENGSPRNKGELIRMIERNSSELSKPEES